jgi:hypothetical protein
MLVTAYDRRSSRPLAEAVAAGAAGLPRSGGPPPAARVVAVGGGWHPSIWRDGLRRAAERGEVAAVAVRTEPTDPRFTDRQWADLARGWVAWAGVAGRPWAAVQTRPGTLTLFTDPTSAAAAAATARSYVRSAVAGQPPAVAALAAEHGDGPADTATPAGIARASFADPPSAAAPPARPAEPAAPPAVRRRGR